MIKRNIAQKAKKMSKKFPIVSIIGPRQSGKTTLAKAMFPEYKYVSLEDLDNRAFAKNDPRGFLESYSEKVIIDEIQKAPNLFSYLQTHIDKTNKVGQYIVTGSENFLLQENITQSLSGRVAILTLLPVSIKELNETKLKLGSSWDYILKGFYPRVYDKSISPEDWYSAYIQTYLERDVRQIVNVRELSDFQKFLKLCAGRAGQILSYSGLASDVGVSPNTVKEWISVLEASFILFKLPVYYRNYNKRITKSPKIYFHDVGLVAHLLGISNREQLQSYYMRGALFENLIISELAKQQYNIGKRPKMFYWKSKSGNEIDCIVDISQKQLAIEVKSSSTITNDFFCNLEYWKGLTGNTKDQLYVVYSGEENQTREAGNVVGWNSIDEVLSSVD